MAEMERKRTNLVSDSTGVTMLDFDMRVAPCLATCWRVAFGWRGVEHSTEPARVMPRRRGRTPSWTCYPAPARYNHRLDLNVRCLPVVTTRAFTDRN